MLERGLSFGGTVVAAAVLAGAAAGAVANPPAFTEAYSTLLEWGVGSRRVAAGLCFVPVLLVGFAAGSGYDYLTRQGRFAPADGPDPAGEAD